MNSIAQWRPIYNLMMTKGQFDDNGDDDDLH